MSDATVQFAHEIARLQGQLVAETAARAGLESRLEKVELAVANMASILPQGPVCFSSDDLNGGVAVIKDKTGHRII